MNPLGDRDLSRPLKTRRVSPEDVTRGDLLVDDFGVVLVASVAPCKQTTPDGSKVDAVIVLDAFDSGGSVPVTSTVDLVCRDSVDADAVAGILQYQEQIMRDNE